MMSTGRKKKGIRLRLHVPQEKAWLFLAVMRFTGKPGGKIVWMEQTLPFAQWFVTKKEPYRLQEKMPAEGNVIQAPNGQVYGEMAAVFLTGTPVSLKTLYPEKSAGTEPPVRLRYR